MSVSVEKSSWVLSSIHADNSPSPCWKARTPYRGASGADRPCKLLALCFQQLLGTVYSLTLWQNNFWDFQYLHPETSHMHHWATSDRTIPRSYRMMQGFGVNTFRLINKGGVAHFVKFHWTPMLGVHSLVWDEALKLAGQDPDFHRVDLHEAIENGCCESH